MCIRNLHRKGNYECTHIVVVGGGKRKSRNVDQIVFSIPKIERSTSFIKRDFCMHGAVRNVKLSMDFSKSLSLLGGLGAPYLKFAGFL